MLYWYHGTDTFRLRSAVTDLVASLRAQHQTALHVVRVDCADAGAADDIERHLKYPSFFGDRTCIIATNAAAPVMADLTARYDFSTLEDIILVAVQDTSQKSADKVVLATLTKTADHTAVFAPLKDAALTAWITAAAAGLGGTLEPDAMRELVRRVGSDSGRCAAELAKLVAYAAPHAISIDAVRLLTPEPAERDEWELSNAIASMDKRSIMAALWKKVREGTPEQLLIGSCAAGLRNLLMIRDAAQRTTSGTTIAKLTGLHPFVVSKTLASATAADEPRLVRSYLALTLLDRDSKDGRADAIDGLFAALLSV